MKILVLGYYDKNNLGDELFKDVFNALLSYHNVVIKNVYNIDFVPYDTDIVIVGGGDVINDYFMNKIKQLLKGFNGPVYAMSIGIPYESAIDDGYLDIFDYIITRNQGDIPKLITRFGAEFVSYFPDFSLFLEDNITNKPKRISIGKQKIGICLANDYYRDNPRFFQETVEYIRKLSDKYIIYLISFNTNEDNRNENDMLLNDKIKNMVTNNIVCFHSRDLSRVLDMFNDLDLCICSRFHSCMISILTETPFIPFYTTRKIYEIVNSLKLFDFSYKINTDSRYKPISFNINALLNLTEFTLKNKGCNTLLIKNYIDENYSKQKYKMIDTINNLIDNKLVRNSPPYYIHEEELKKIVDDVVDSVLKYFNKSTLYEVDNKDLLTEVLCFKLTKICKPVYYHGLRQKLDCCDFDYISDLTWLVKDFYKSSNNIFSLSYKEYMGGCISKHKKNEAEIKLNLTYIDQNELKGYHRSGWQYVINEMYKYNSEDHDSIFIDTYVDRTFLWKSEVYKAAGILPYIKPWAGFIHHTFDANYTQNNVGEILKNSDFIKSLSTCKCLFVLSKYLRDNLRSELKKMNINTPVKALIHPTESSDVNFKFSNLQNNKCKKLIQIGAWLRNTYAIFELDITGSSFSKCALKGKNMDNYYRDPEDISKRLLDCTCDNKDIDGICRDKMCRGEDCIKKCDNKYVIGLDKHVKNLHKSVNIISEISNDDYDNLLSENIVFLNLVDASAVNTLIECYIRNTPVIVNPLPAVVELLGKDYPLYYTDYSDVRGLLEMSKIKKAYKYLKKQDKKILSIDFFMKNFNRKLNKVL